MICKINEIEYLINKKECTASVNYFIVRLDEKNSYRKIPRTIRYENDDYLVTGLSKSKLKFTQVNTITISKGSELRVIEDDTFSHSLTKSITISTNVTKIGKYAFKSCRLLKKFEIPDDSKLEIIEEGAFFGSFQLESFKFPSELTIIGEKSFSFCRQLKSIEFAQNSKLKIIGKEAFSDTSIESISIPSNLIELREGWCKLTLKLTKISVSVDNPFFKVYEEKLLIKKSSLDKENYDELVFCVRNAETVTIPDFIEHICSYAFDGCRSINTIEFGSESKLRIIGKFAFSGTRIKSIKIPSKVTLIEECVFCNCSFLEQVEFQSDSQLQSIKERAFAFLELESIRIPSQVKHIENYAFGDCYILKNIEFPDDSELKIIDKNALKGSKIDSISIPSKLVELKDGFFKNMAKVAKINISPDNQYFKFFNDKLMLRKSSLDKENYDELIFSHRDIQKVTIPKFIEHIKKNAFYLCKKLKSVDFENESKLRIIDKKAFIQIPIEKIVIPSHVTLIGDKAFNLCRRINHVDFDKDSKLQIIGSKTFKETSIKSIKIPSQVKEIGRKAFYHSKLQSFEIESQSQLQTFNEKSFHKTSIKNVRIPPSINNYTNF